jgi:hypothetical protein
VIAWQRQTHPAWSQYQVDPRVRMIVPSLTGEPELCLTCHYGIEEISESHPVDVFGCVSCHGGDRLSLDKEVAHTGLIGTETDPGNPTDLSVVQLGCGTADCHDGVAAEERDHIARAMRSVQATYAGAINAMLDAQGIRPAGAYFGTIAVRDDELTDPLAVPWLNRFVPDEFDTPGVATFGAECLSCHVAGEPRMAPYFYRGTGCAACHVYYANDGLYQGGDPTISQTEPGHAATHQMTIAIPYAQCNHCHNRGAYSLEEISFSVRADVPASAGLTSTDRRFVEIYISGSTHYTLCQRELDCIDCHTSYETMGSGDVFVTQADARAIECRTCHGTLTELPATVTLQDPNDPTFRRAALNPFYDVFVGNTVVLAPTGEAMGHIRVEGEVFSLFSKTASQSWLVPLVPGSTCEQQLNQQAAIYCQECHTYDPASGS